MPLSEHSKACEPRSLKGALANSLKANLLAVGLGYGLAIVVGFVLTPLIISKLGKEAYGTWSILFAISSYLVLFDLGIPSSLTRLIAIERTKQSPQFSSILSSALAILSGPFFGVLILVFLGAHFLPNFFGASMTSSLAIQSCLFILGLDMALEIVSALLKGSLAGFERFAVLHGLNVSRLVLSGVFSLVALGAGLGLPGLALSVLGSRCLQRIFLWRALKREIPDLQLHPRMATWQQAKSLLSFGLWIGMSATAARLSYQCDTLIIGVVYGALAVAPYAVALSLLEQLRNLLQLGMPVLLARLSALQHLAGKNSEQARALLLRSATALQLIAVAVVGSFYFTGQDFVRLWVGAEMADSWNFFMLLSLAFLLHSPALALAYGLQAAGLHAIYARLLLTEALLNVALSVALVRPLGPAGVAMATLIAGALVSGIIVPLIAASRLSLTLRDYLLAAFLRPLGAALVYLSALVVLSGLIGTSSWGDWITVNALASAILLLGSLITMR